MGANAEAEIPILDLGKQGLVLEGLEQLQGSDEKWKAMCMKVREACEYHGWFVLKCDDSIIPKSLRQEMFVAMKALFDLPEETKQKHTSPKPYNSYIGKCPVIPLSESFGIDDAAQPDVGRAFTNVMWPQGNPSFCETINSMSSKLLEMNFMVLRMILESFGIMEKYYESHLENSSSALRLMKYKVPPPSDEGGAAIGLVPHTDKNFLTILFQNDVQGLEVLTRQGNWVQLEIPEGSFTVIVGDTLKAWSNGRLHAPRHRVKLRGVEKERYSCGLFLLHKEGMVIEVPQELIDKDHPLLYRPFNYQDYLTYFVSNITDDALEVYAGINSSL